MKMPFGHGTDGLQTISSADRFASTTADFSQDQRLPAQNQPYRMATEKSPRSALDGSEFTEPLKMPFCDEVNSRWIARFSDSALLRKFGTDAEIGHFFRKDFIPDRVDSVLRSRIPNPDSERKSRNDQLRCEVARQ